MSRAFMYAPVVALSVHILSGSVVMAQPLNINPFPLERAGTLSSQGPVIEQVPAVQKFADDNDKELIRLEEENEALELQLRELEMQRKMEQEEFSRKQEEISLERKNRELAAELKALTEEKKLARESVREKAQLEKHLASLAAQQAADRQAESVSQDLARVETSANVGLEPVDAIRMQRAQNAGRVVEMNRSFSDLGLGGIDGDVDMIPMPITAQDKVGAPMSDSRVARAIAAEAKTPEAPQMLKPVVKKDMVVASAPVQVQPRSTNFEAKAEKYDLAFIPMPGSVEPSSVQYAPREVVRSNYLSASAGESLEDVLRSWSQSQGVGFLWKTTQRFDVLKPVSGDGGYEAAVEGLLSQYNGNGLRPVGRLQTDPVTGFTTLSILSE